MTIDFELNGMGCRCRESFAVFAYQGLCKNCKRLPTPSTSCRLVPEIGAKPALDLLDWLAFPARVIEDLILADAPDRKIPRRGMSEVQAADAGRRRHRRVIGQVDAGGSRVEQVEQFELLAVIGAGGIAEARTDPSVCFGD